MNRLRVWLLILGMPLHLLARPETDGNKGGDAQIALQKADSILDQAQIALENGDFEVAATAVIQALRMEYTLADTSERRIRLHKICSNLLAGMGGYKMAAREAEVAFGIRRRQDSTRVNNGQALRGKAATYYLRAGETEMALKLFQENYLEVAAKGVPFSEAAAVNNLGICQMALDSLEAARVLFQEAWRKIPEEKRGFGLGGSVQHNLGLVAAESGDYAAALVHFEKAAEIFESRRNVGKQARVALSKARVGVSMGKFDAAVGALNRARQWMSESTAQGRKDLELQYQRLLVEFRLAKRDLQGLKAALIRQNEVSDSLTKARGVSLQYFNNGVLAFQEELRAKEHARYVNVLDAQSRRLQALSDSSQKSRWIAVLVVAVSLLLILFLVSALRRRAALNVRMKEFATVQQALITSQLEKEKLESERLRLELDLKKRDLTNMALDIARKRDWMNQLLSELDRLKSGEKEAETRSLLVDMRMQLNVDEKLAHFQENVEVVNQEFYAKLSTAFPGLTKTERELCGLIRLNLSGKEIASLRNISPNSVKMSRNRLRKKLGLEPEEDLYAFLQQF
ncbi:MAG: tetratricopeptide repeat protein [Bacteroidota bacterium]